MKEKVKPQNLQASRRAPGGSNDLDGQKQKGKDLLSAMDQVIKKALSKKDSLSYLLQGRQEGGE